MNLKLYNYIIFIIEHFYIINEYFLYLKILEIKEYKWENDSA